MLTVGGNLCDKFAFRVVRIHSLPAIFITLLVAFAVVLGAVLPANAKGGPLGFWPEPADAVMHEVVETPYAEVLLKRFAANVRKNGDAACLLEKRLDEGELISRGRTLFQTYGVRFMKLQDENFDDAVARATFAALEGSDARAELDRLMQHPDVQKLEALYRPIPLAKLLETILEQFDQYLMIAGITLDPASPVARNPDLARVHPVLPAEAAVQAFLEKNPSPKVIDRFLDLMEAELVATNRAVKKNGVGEAWTGDVFRRR